MTIVPQKENVPVGGGGDMGHGHDAIQEIPGISPPKLEKEHGRNISLCLFWLIKIVIELEVESLIRLEGASSQYILLIRTII
jgi:hypothetical protein